jgi:hypothetical protein
LIGAGCSKSKNQQLDVIVKQNEDNVFVKLKLSVQFAVVVRDTVCDAFYKLEYARQITSW